MSWAENLTTLPGEMCCGLLNCADYSVDAILMSQPSWEIFGEVSCVNIVAECRYRSWIGYEFPNRL